MPDFDSLYVRYRVPVFRYLLRTVKYPALAEDLTQDTFLKLWRAYRDCADIDAPGRLIYTIAKGLLIDNQRHYRGYLERGDSLSIDLFLTNGWDMEDGHSGTETLAILRADACRRVSQLHPSYQRALLEATDERSEQRVQVCRARKAYHALEETPA